MEDTTLAPAMSPEEIEQTTGPESKGAHSSATLLAFFALAFAWSWLIGLGARYAMTESQVMGTLLAMVSGFGPSLAAMALVTRFSHGAGLRDWLSRCLNWRVGWRWYAVAFGLPPAIMLLALALEFVLGGAIPASPAAGKIPLAIANFGLVLLVGGPLGEEFGWRGYATPAMARWLNWRLTSLLIGAIWGLWHLPLFFMADTPQAHLPFLLFLISTMAESVMFGWLFVNTSASLVPSLVMHTSLNAWFNIIPLMPTATGHLRPLALMVGIQTLVAMAVAFQSNGVQSRRS
jgi:membrane protease YdiL (CAAX protease family)